MTVAVRVDDHAPGGNPRRARLYELLGYYEIYPYKIKVGVHRISDPAGYPGRIVELSGIRYPAGYFLLSGRIGRIVQHILVFVDYR